MIFKEKDETMFEKPIEVEGVSRIMNPLRFLGAPRRLLGAIGSYFSMPGPSDEFLDQKRVGLTDEEKKLIILTSLHSKHGDGPYL